MGYAVGGLLSLLVLAFARVSAFDRDRAFYPTVLIVVASYYVLFAAIDGSIRTVAVESAVTIAFAVLAVAGFKRSLWVVAAGLAAHGVLDFFHADVVHNAGVPAWWPAFCLAYDVGAAAGLAWLLATAGASPRLTRVDG